MRSFYDPRKPRVVSTIISLPSEGPPARCVKVLGAILVTCRMRCDGCTVKNSSMSSPCAAAVSLPFSDQCVGQAGWGKHSAEKKKGTHDFLEATL